MWMRLLETGDAALRALLRVPVHLYRWCLAPLLPPSCRHEPTCSRYALEALRVHPTHKALYLIARRLWRCQPMYPAGHDPVPPRGAWPRPTKPEVPTD